MSAHELNRQDHHKQDAQAATTIGRLKETADYFYDLAHGARAVGRKYRRAHILTKLATFFTKRAMRASYKASDAGKVLLYGEEDHNATSTSRAVVANPDIPVFVPRASTAWQEYFTSVDAEMQRERAAAAATAEAKDKSES